MSNSTTTHACPKSFDACNPQNKPFFILMSTDPAEWNAGHVRSWLKWSARQFNLNPEPDADKFPTSGAELLELSRAEFETKAGSARAGRLLAIHLAHLRHSVTGRSTSPLQDHVDLDHDEEQGKCTSNQKSFICLSPFPLTTHFLKEICPAISPESFCFPTSNS
jgi:hypothetical protein